MISTRAPEKTAHQPPSSGQPPSVKASKKPPLQDRVRFRSPVLLAAVAITTLLMVIIARSLKGYTHHLEVELFREFIRTGEGSPEMAQHLAQWLPTLHYSALATVVCALGFIAWFRRVHWNLYPLGHSKLHTSPQWSIVSWLIPLVNLYWPYAIAVDINWRSDPRGEQETMPLAISLWWLAFAAGAALHIWSLMITGPLVDASIQELAFELVRASSILEAFSACMAIVVVVGITRRQLARHQNPPISVEVFS